MLLVQAKCLPCRTEPVKMNVPRGWGVGEILSLLSVDTPSRHARGDLQSVCATVAMCCERQQPRLSQQSRKVSRMMDGYGRKDDFVNQGGIMWTTSFGIPR